MEDSRAKELLQGLVNDNDLIRAVCAKFAAENNLDTKCYAVGKLYDIKGESQGCLTILSQDAVNIVGEDYLQDTQEKLNFLLITTFFEYRRFCKGLGEEAYNAWDDYLDVVVQKNFLPLYMNGVRVRLLYDPVVQRSDLPSLVFIVYQKYDEY